MVDDEKYFLCDVRGFKLLADMIEHVSLPIVTRYVFCCAPIKLNESFICTQFVQVRVLLCRCVFVVQQVSRAVVLCDLHVY